MMDVTEAKNLEDFLRVEDKMISLGRVAAGIAHEIRNPLSGINIYLNTLGKALAEKELDEKVKGLLSKLQSASNKVESVIRRVMDFARSGAPRLVVTDINGPVQEAIGLSSVTLRKSGVRIETALSEAPLPCRIDSQMIEQVILNLISNAAEAMKDMKGEKRIGVATYAEKGRVFVTVSDSGPGVTGDQKDRIFDPFYSTKENSSGIGLSISRRIISDHGGTIKVDPGRWGGAQFSISLPSAKVSE
jgi:signal transduction histidine kinase